MWAVAQALTLLATNLAADVAKLGVRRARTGGGDLEPVQTVFHANLVIGMGARQLRTDKRDVLARRGRI